MKPIKMGELKPGDLFAHQLQLRGRTAFKVVEVLEKHVVCRERSLLPHLPNQKKLIKGYVYLLKRGENHG